MKDKRFRPYDPDQSLLLPPNMNDWLPEGHPASFIREVVRKLDLAAVYDAYADGAKGGKPPCDPRMMTGLLLYAYCKGIRSSRKIEEATYESIPFRVLAADQHPDHDTICDFRKRHLAALSDLFVQVLDICREAGLAKLGHVALDGTKVLANASKHKAMSYGRMPGALSPDVGPARCAGKKRRAELRAEIEELMARAEAVDAEEDALYGKGKRGDELPEELRFRETRLAKIEEAMAALEAEAKTEADARRAEIAEKEKERRGKEERTGKGTPGARPKPPSDEPEDKAQRPQVRTAQWSGPSGQLHRSRIADHGGRGDEGVRAGVQLRGRGRCRLAGDRRRRRYAGCERPEEPGTARQEADQADGRASEDQHGREAEGALGRRRFLQRGEREAS
jgi:transposase